MMMLLAKMKNDLKAYQAARMATRRIQQYLKRGRIPGLLDTTSIEQTNIKKFFITIQCFN